MEGRVISHLALSTTGMCRRKTLMPMEGRVMMKIGLVQIFTLSRKTLMPMEGRVISRRLQSAQSCWFCRKTLMPMEGRVIKLEKVFTKDVIVAKP